MSNKITARFGADVSEVESKMIAATRATKYYENAVKQVAKAESMRGAAGGGLMGSIGSKAPQLVGRIKELAGAFGAAGAAAGLVPGLGMAALGVAAVVAGVKKIRDYYVEAAEKAKEIRDLMLQAGQKAAAETFGKSTEAEKLKILKEQTLNAEIAWKIAVANGKDDVDILKKRAEFDAARIAYEKQLAVVENARRAKAKKDADDQRKRLQQDRKDREDTAAAIERKRVEMEESVAEVVGEITERQKQNDKEEAERVKELGQLRYDAIWRYATLEQKLAQAVKEGREAQAKAEKDASTENLLALEKARNKYRDILDLVNAANDAKKDGAKAGDSRRNADGRFVTESGNVVVSDADRARSDALRRRDAAHNARTQSQAISSSTVGRKDQTGAKTHSDKVLEDIRDLLKPAK